MAQVDFVQFGEAEASRLSYSQLSPAEDVRREGEADANKEALTF